MSTKKRRLAQDDTDTPSKKSRGRKSSAQKAALVSSINKAVFDDMNDRYLQITKYIMFANGDSNNPLDANAHMLLGLMQSQIRTIMDGSLKRANDDGRTEVSLLDILFHFRRHKLVVGRLLNFVKAASSIRSLTLSTRPESGDDNGKDSCGSLTDSTDEDEEEEDDDDDQLKKHNLPNAGSLFSQLVTVVDNLHAEYTATELLSSEFVDATRDARARRIAMRVKRLRPCVYYDFSEARAAVYVPRHRPKTIHGLSEYDLFTAWLGIPRMSTSVCFILSWLAKEIVTQVVDDAYMCYLRELTAGIIKGGPPTGQLTIKHYEEGLRKNLGWRSKGDVLFGYF